MSGWWRRNRWGLLLLPVAAVVALAASSSRLDDYWWSQGFHDRAAVSGGVASLVDEYDDGHLRYPIEARYSLRGFEQVDVERSDGSPMPDTLTAWRVSLHVEADPGTALSGCSVALVDADGNRYGSRDAGGAGLDLPVGADCVPTDTPGPQATFGSDDAPALPEGTSARPAEYDTDTIVVTPSDVTPVSVRLWYFLPRYVELPVETS